LIPITSDDGGTAFVKDSAGQVVKSKLDEKRLREIAQATGGFYLHLDDGPRTMSQLYAQGLASMKAADIDARLGRRPIERYEWPLGAAMLALTMSILIGERKRVRARVRVPQWSKIAVPATALLLIFARPAFGAAKANLEEVKKKIERLKQRPKQKPTPPPQQQNKKDKNQQQSGGGGEQNQDQQQSQSQSSSGKDQNQNQQQQQQQQQNQQAQSQNQSGSSQSKNFQDKSNQAQAK